MSLLVPIRKAVGSRFFKSSGALVPVLLLLLPVSRYLERERERERVGERERATSYMYQSLPAFFHWMQNVPIILCSVFGQSFLNLLCSASVDSYEMSIWDD